MTREEAADHIAKQVTERFPAYSCKAEPSHLDASILRVKVFNVPKKNFSEVRNFVRSLDKSDQFFLSLAIKDVEITRMYYSNFYKPSENAAPQQKVRGYEEATNAIQKFIKETRAKLAEGDPKTISFWRGKLDGLILAHSILAIGQYPNVPENDRRIKAPTRAASPAKKEIKKRNRK